MDQPLRLSDTIEGARWSSGCVLASERYELQTRARAEICSGF